MSPLDAARERVVRLLTDRYADDSLTVEQFEARLDRMHTLDDPAALDAMARELMVAPGAPTRDVPVASAPAPAALVRGSAVGGVPRRSLVVMSDQKYRGAFVVPAQWELRTVMSSLRVDFREAHFVDGRCDVDLFAMMSSVEILVRADVSLATEIGGIMASIETPEWPSVVPPSAGALRIGGMAIMSSVEVRIAPAWMPADAPFKAVWRAAQVRD